MMGLIGLTMICSLAVFADKRNVTPRLSLVNVANLNIVLRFEVFVSEDKQLRAVHLILDFRINLRQLPRSGPSDKGRRPKAS